MGKNSQEASIIVYQYFESYTFEFIKQYGNASLLNKFKTLNKNNNNISFKPIVNNNKFIKNLLYFPLCNLIDNIHNITHLDQQSDSNSTLFIWKLLSINWSNKALFDKIISTTNTESIDALFKHIVYDDLNTKSKHIVDNNPPNDIAAFVDRCVMAIKYMSMSLAFNLGCLSSTWKEFSCSYDTIHVVLMSVMTTYNLLDISQINYLNNCYLAKDTTVKLHNIIL
jgi:hypothetical protein